MAMMKQDFELVAEAIRYEYGYAVTPDAKVAIENLADVLSRRLAARFQDKFYKACISHTHSYGAEPRTNVCECGHVLAV